MGYFNIKLKPDLVEGDISKLIANDKTDTPFTADDILFDWQEVDVPNGTISLDSVTAYMIGEDGGVQADKDFSLVFAKSVNGVAPTTLGSVNAAQTACFELPLHYIGAMKLEATSTVINGLSFGTAFSWGAQGANGIDRSIIMTPETISGRNVGYDKLYVAGFAGGAFDFSTGVLSTEVIDASEATKATIAVDTVDARKAFQKGDIAYVHDVDTVIPGTVLSVTENLITFDTTNSTIDVDNNDEIINATPITIYLGFSQ
tara:strand:- start:1079 stop:1855 length:777 start_codon:yes stop_codon:yes gene_type:complete